ncbi:MAG: nicotinate-nucleotide adenylyltransferase [Acidobacteriota bacterium]|nr:nicotinate-nucleotide adenylyltransferase [Acidobacteriota bacterium]
MKPRIGLFGGTFNPIHQGHLKAAEEVRSRLSLSRVLFIPSFIPPHKQTRDVAPPEDRLRMVELACRSHPHFVASAVEVEARETSYSIITIEKIKKLYPRAWLLFILGVDAFLEIETWRDYRRVLEECRFAVMTRPGYALEDAGHLLAGRLRDRTREVTAPLGPGDRLFSRARIFLVPIEALDVSSTEIRKKIRNGDAIDGLLPPEVAEYIRKHRLYIS